MWLDQVIYLYIVVIGSVYEITASSSESVLCEATVLQDFLGANDPREAKRK